MKLASTIARILLGLIFLASGISGFLIISHPPPPPPGLAGQFTAIFFASRWVLFVDGVQALCGLALLIDRYVPLALVTVAAIIYNITVFHLMMLPQGIFAPLVLIVLWILVAQRFRATLRPLLAAKP